MKTYTIVPVSHYKKAISSCEKKEGVYFEKNIEWADSTDHLYNYTIYSSGEIMYQEYLGLIIKVKDVGAFKDSLQELHKDKFDYFYIICN
jgi:hypothetical protein